MGRKRGHRSNKAISKEKFPIGTLAAKRKQTRDAFIENCHVYKAEASKLKRVKEKVNRIQREVEVLQPSLMTRQIGSLNKRKFLRRIKYPTCLREDNSEELEVPAAKRSCQRRKRETLDACQEIHGGNSVDKSPVLDALWVTLVHEATPTTLVRYLSKSNKIMKKVIPKIIKNTITSFQDSLVNQVRSVKALYSNGLLSKEKYKSIRRNISMTSSKSRRQRTSIKLADSIPLPKLLNYDKVIQFVHSVDMGNVKDIKDFCYNLDEDNQVQGAYRDLEIFLLDLATMYIDIDKANPFLLHFGCQPYHFRVAIGADGAPMGKDDEATAWLISFLNVGQKIASQNENFILAGANCNESHPAMVRFAQKLISDIASIEKKNYLVSTEKVNFTFELVPSDMKWASTFSGELSNAAHFFSPFGNVNSDNKFIVNGSLGPSECTWKPWVYKERLEIATKVEGKKQELSDTNLADSTKRSKLLTFIKNLNSRQEFTPILGPLVDKIYAEPLHNANNAWELFHLHMLNHANEKSKIPTTCIDPSKVLDCPLVLHMSTLKLIGATRLYKKVKKWFCQGRKGSFSYRFTGKETKKMCQHFMSIIKAITCENDLPTQSLQLNILAFVGLQLREATSRMSRVMINQEVVQEVNECCRKYFNACSLLLGRVTPTVWTIGYAIPYHTKLLYDKFGVGLGINTMQGREAKHVRISQYTKHATLTTRWKHVMTHDFMSTIWLRIHDPMSFSYHKSLEVYTPRGIDQPESCICGLKKESDIDRCLLCSSKLYRSIEKSADTGQLDPFICNLLSVTQQ